MIAGRHGAGQPGRIAAVVVVAAVAVALIGYPLARLAATVADLGPGAIGGAIGGVGGRAVATSLGLALIVAVLAVTMGTIVAVVGERASPRRRRLVRVALIGQLFVPSFVSALGWAAAYGPRGISDRWLGISLPGMYGLPGVIVVLAVEAVPLAYLVVAGALASRDEADLERAARASGASAVDALWTITLPLLRRPIAAAGVLVAVMTLNAFGVPAVLGLGGGVSTITTRLYQDLAFSADPASFDRAIVLAFVLVAVSLTAVIGADRLQGRRGSERTGSVSAPPSEPARASRIGVALIGVGVVVAAVIPFVALVLVALTRAVGLPPTPENWTLANIAAVLDVRTVGPLVRSVGLAIAAATLATLLGAAVVAIGRRAGRGLGTVVAVGFAVPGSTLALAVLLGYGAALRDTLAIILVAYLAKFWALGHRPIAGAVDRFPMDLWRAARASGARPADVLRSVVWPLLRPSIAGAWLIVFLFAVHEVTMSTLLYGPGTDTLAVVTMNTQQLGDPTVSAALAVVLTALVSAAALPMVLLRRAAIRPMVGE